MAAGSVKKGTLRPAPILPALAVAPANPVQGQQYFSTTLNQPQVWTGQSWITPGPGAEIAYTEAAAGAYWLGAANSANASYLGPCDGTFYNYPNVSITVPAGIAARIFMEIEMAPVLAGLAAALDIWWAAQIYDTFAAAPIDGDFWRMNTGPTARPANNDYMFKKLSTSVGVPAQAQQRTYQVRVGASASLNAGSGVEIFHGGAFNTVIKNKIYAVQRA